MAGVTTISDMVLYNAEFHTGIAEGVAQNLDALNAGAQGTIVIVPNEHRGDYKKESFWKKQTLIGRRDDTSSSAATAITMDQDETVSVKVKRRAGPVDITYDSLANVESSTAEAARLFGKNLGEQKMEDMLNTGILALEAALEGAASSIGLSITAESTKTVNPDALNRVIAKFGDRANRLRAWVMHSKPNFDVVGNLISSAVTGLTDLVTIQGAIPALLGRSAVVSDVPALHDANGSATDTYNTLCLVAGALEITESDPEVMLIQDVTGLDNLVRRFQAEYSYTIKIKGFSYDFSASTAGRNPDDTALGTSANWTQVATSIKDLAGVRLVSQ